MFESNNRLELPDNMPLQKRRSIMNTMLYYAPQWNRYSHNNKNTPYKPALFIDMDILVLEFDEQKWNADNKYKHIESDLCWSNPSTPLRTQAHISWKHNSHLTPSCVRSYYKSKLESTYNPPCRLSNTFVVQYWHVSLSYWGATEIKITSSDVCKHKTTSKM